MPSVLCKLYDPPNLAGYDTNHTIEGGISRHLSLNHPGHPLQDGQRFLDAGDRSTVWIRQARASATGSWNVQRPATAAPAQALRSFRRQRHRSRSPRDPSLATQQNERLRDSPPRRSYPHPGAGVADPVQHTTRIMPHWNFTTLINSSVQQHSTQDGGSGGSQRAASLRSRSSSGSASSASPSEAARREGINQWYRQRQETKRNEFIAECMTYPPPSKSLSNTSAAWTASRRTKSVSLSRSPSPTPGQLLQLPLRPRNLGRLPQEPAMSLQHRVQNWVQHLP